MKPTEELKDEHQAIKLALKILGKICEKLELGAGVDPAHLENMVDFIRTFADRCHHGKEEDLLFPEMEKAGMPREGGPIGVMLTEHDAGRRFVKGMIEAAGQYRAGESGAASQFAENARNYIDLLTRHIDKEDNILYPMADKLLPEDRQQALLADFAKVEAERIGAGRHEAFHQMLHELREIYLV